MLHKEGIIGNFENDIKQHEPLIHKVCRMYARLPDDRKDLFQEIVIQLWKAYPGFRGDAKLSTWMYRVSLNTAITHLRRQRTGAGAELLRIDAIHEIPDQEEDARWQEMYKAIEQLNHVEKAVVMLYLEEKPYNEMEEIIGISTGAIRVKMSRIKKKLRLLIKNN